MNVFTTRFGKFVSGVACAFGGAKKPSNLLKKASFDVYDKKFGGESFISSIKQECDIYFADPDCSFVCSNAFYKYFFKGVLKAYKKEKLDAINRDMPLLLIAGEQDPVGNAGKGVTKLEEMYKKIGVKTVQKILYTGVRHEFLNDVSRSDAYKDITLFFDSAL